MLFFYIRYTLTTELDINSEWGFCSLMPIILFFSLLFTYCSSWCQWKDTYRKSVIRQLNCTLYFMCSSIFPATSFGALGCTQPWDERNALLMAIFWSPTWHMIRDGSLRCCPRQLNAQLTCFCLLFPLYFLAAPNMHSCYMWLVIRAFSSRLEMRSLQKLPARTEFPPLPGGRVLVQPKSPIHCAC